MKRYLVYKSKEYKYEDTENYFYHFVFVIYGLYVKNRLKPE